MLESPEIQRLLFRAPKGQALVPCNIEQQALMNMLPEYDRELTFNHYFPSHVFCYKYRAAAKPIVQYSFSLRRSQSTGTEPKHDSRSAPLFTDPPCTSAEMTVDISRTYDTGGAHIRPDRVDCSLRDLDGLKISFLQKVAMEVANRVEGLKGDDEIEVSIRFSMPNGNKTTGAWEEEQTIS